MSLYGALYSGVSGLKAQGNKIGIISDNIANVNTVGYKQGQAQFQTLVTGSGTAAYSPGGVLAGNRQLVDKQGLIQSTDSATDIAISGNGFFAVNAQSDGTGLPLYTRAGSFRQDSLGNFINAGGFYLQGWPLDRDGRLPGAPGNVNTVSSANLSSLETVNVSAATGVASATSTVAIGANLKASQTVFPGSGAIADMDVFSAANFGITADSIIVPSEFGATTTNSIVRGDRFSATTGAGLTYTFQYGGFTAGRQVTTAGVGNVGDAGFDLTPQSIANSIDTDGATNVVTVTLAGHGYTTGDVITLSGVSTLGADTIPLSEINGPHTITVTGANTFTFTTSSSSTVAVAGTGGASATAAHRSYAFAGNILDATSTTQTFLSITGTDPFTTAALTFTITSSSGGAKTFTYTSSSPNSLLGQFNNITNLATAINDATGLTARVVGGRLYVGAENANDSLTFTNGDDAGVTSPVPLAGIDWIRELDMTDVNAASNRFSTLQGLADLANNSPGLSATVTNPLSAATVTINVEDPLDTIRFRDNGTATPLGNDAFISTAGAGGGPYTETITVTAPGHSFSVGDTVTFAGVTGFDNITAGELNGSHTITAVTGSTYSFSLTSAGDPAGGVAGGGTTATSTFINSGSILAELGIVPTLNGGAFVQGDSGVLGPQYDASDSSKNMASGATTAQFSRDVRVFDAQGSGHEIRLSFLKLDTNRWAVEVHAVPETDVNTTLVDGQIAVGTIDFNGDGSLRSVSSGLSNAVTVNWTNGSDPTSMAFDWGTSGPPFGTIGATVTGKTDGLSQFDSDYKVAFVNQNGAQVGELTSVSIDKDGFVIASYSNGETQRVFKLPIADFNNPNGLRAVSGNVYAQTQESGEVNLSEAGRSGAGGILASSLETSNVELAEQLTDMIVAQRAYQANTRIIRTADELLDGLNQL